MATLEQIRPGARVLGLSSDGPCEVIAARWVGTAAIDVTYRDAAGRTGSRLLYRQDEPTLAVASATSGRDFSADGFLFRMVSEARRIQLGYLFDPVMAVHTSLVEPLPHQITAVYGEMLPRQPLRFLLADDPGAGKTIMAGLLIKELMVRGDVARCMVVCPGSLVEQWQDELWEKFHLSFQIMTSEGMEAARSGNWFAEHHLAICRLDKLARDDRLHPLIAQSSWDLVICDEAHKMSAGVYGNEVSYTERYQLGELLSTRARHFLLLTATPHSGREQNFQLFLKLLDPDRFEGAHRRGAHAPDASDIMRRLVKEQLRRFDGSPLFPERHAYTLTYELSAAEQDLYDRVTEYVRREFNRADRLSAEGRGTVGFALTVLQRRLASSPEAIYRSLQRRRERLERRLDELRVAGTADISQSLFLTPRPAILVDQDDATGAERESQEEAVLDEATAATTQSELAAEITVLLDLERVAAKVRTSGLDRKWEELSRIIQDRPEMRNADGARRKLIIFTEHLDTLRYLGTRITSMLGNTESVVTMFGSMARKDRVTAQEAFRNDPAVHFLIATDAAGEGINLQRAHLMVNYDLPWNPNRIEQRFGRIHRIGQTEVCHLWNLVAANTREGEVFQQLFRKLAQMRAALGGAVFDVLGRLFREDRLEDLLVQAVRYGERPDVKARLFQKVEDLLEQERVRQLIDDRSLVRDSMDTSQIQKVREDMERAEARRLQPHHISGFFIAAFEQFGGSVRQRESGRYEIQRVPQVVRDAAMAVRPRDPLPQAYERVTFEKKLINVPGMVQAEFICPGHPLLDAAVQMTLDQLGPLLQRGAVLIDPADAGDEARLLVYLEHTIEDGRRDRAGNRSVASRQFQFVELHDDGSVVSAGYAPYLDYRPPTQQELAILRPVIAAPWLSNAIEGRAVEHAVAEIIPRHLDEVRQRRGELVRKTMAAVQERLTHEIQHWNRRFVELKAQEEAGRQPRMNPLQAQRNVEELEGRRSRRLTELEEELHLSPLPPLVTGAAVVVPQGILARLDALGKTAPVPAMTRDPEVESLAMAAVMAEERSLGFEPRDVSAEKRGYDIESRMPDGRLRFIEVKGRSAGAESVFVTRNEVIACLNKPDQFILALVEVQDGAAVQLRYVRNPFERELDFAVTSVAASWSKLIEAAEPNS